MCYSKMYWHVLGEGSRRREKKDVKEIEFADKENLIVVVVRPEGKYVRQIAEKCRTVCNNADKKIE